MKRGKAKELWIKAQTMEEAYKIADKVNKFSEKYMGEFKVVIYCATPQSIKRCSVKLNEIAINIFKVELGEENVKVIENAKETYISPSKQNSLKRIADALEELIEVLSYDRTTT